MKTKAFYLGIVFLLIISFNSLSTFAQSKKSIAIISLDTKGIDLDNTSMANLVRLELEKTNVFEASSVRSFQIQKKDEQSGVQSLLALSKVRRRCSEVAERIVLQTGSVVPRIVP